MNDSPSGIMMLLVDGEPYGTMRGGLAMFTKNVIGASNEISRNWAKEVPACRPFALTTRTGHFCL